jgi:hypothetical protein
VAKAGARTPTAGTINEPLVAPIAGYIQQLSSASSSPSIGRGFHRG